MSFTNPSVPKYLVAIDFDNTIVIPTKGLSDTSGYVPNFRAIELITSLYKDYNCRFILFTSRGGVLKTLAIDYLKSINLWEYFIEPTSPEYIEITGFLPGEKPYADFYIDDLSVGCPVKREGFFPFVDFPAVYNIIVKALTK